jgi:hypothetical protein
MWAPFTQYVGAIHGRLLTAWSTAGIVGPVIVNYMHDTGRRHLRSDLSPDFLRSGRAAGRRLHCQSADQAIGQEVVHQEEDQGRRPTALQRRAP